MEIHRGAILRGQFTGGQFSGEQFTGGGGGAIHRGAIHRGEFTGGGGGIHRGQFSGYHSMGLKKRAPQKGNFGNCVLSKDAKKSILTFIAICLRFGHFKT